MEAKTKTGPFTQFSQLIQQGLTHSEDSGDPKRMWSILADELKKYDEHVTNFQNDNINSVLVFTGLFSAIVAVFVVESYKKLSLDSGDRTTFLLEQISRQLAGFENNTYPPFQDSSPFSPGRTILWVNILWFLSLVTSIVSGFYVMLAQQWVRRYNQMSQELSRDQGRVRSSLFRGARKYRMSKAIGMMPILLNIAVFLFLSGLILFLFTVSSILATMVTVCTGLFGLVYFVLTIFPTIDDVCPYFTPMSDVWWYLWHTPLFATAFFLRGFMNQFRDYSLPCHRNEGSSFKQGILTKLSRRFGKAFKKRMQCIKDGLRGSIIRQALAAPVAADLWTLTWLLQRPAMAEKGNIQEFVDSVPRETLLQLSYVPVESGQITIREHLSNLLRSCTQDTNDLDHDVRKRRILVCLDAFHHIVKSSPVHVPYGASLSETVLSDVWSNFGDIRLLQTLWADSDANIRVTSRSICAHLARHILHGHWPGGEAELAWLREIMRSPGCQTFYAPNLPERADHMNLKSFVYGVLFEHTDDLSAKSRTRFAETLAILMNAGSSATLSREIFEGELFSFIEWVENNDHGNHDVVVAKLRKMFGIFLHVDSLSMTDDQSTPTNQPVSSAPIYRSRATAMARSLDSESMDRRATN